MQTNQHLDILSFYNLNTQREINDFCNDFIDEHIWSSPQFIKDTIWHLLSEQLKIKFLQKNLLDISQNFANKINHHLDGSLSGYVYDDGERKKAKNILLTLRALDHTLFNEVVNEKPSSTQQPTQNNGNCCVERKLIDNIELSKDEEFDINRLLDKTPTSTQNRSKPVRKSNETTHKQNQSIPPVIPIRISNETTHKQKQTKQVPPHIRRSNEPTYNQEQTLRIPPPIRRSNEPTHKQTKQVAPPIQRSNEPTRKQKQTKQVLPPIRKSNETTHKQEQTLRIPPPTRRSN